MLAKVITYLPGNACYLMSLFRSDYRLTASETLACWSIYRKYPRGLSSLAREFGLIACHLANRNTHLIN